MTPEQVIRFVKDNQVEMIDLKFTDLPGTWQHFSITVPQFTEEIFKVGIGFDGSSIRGFQSIEESDMLLIADSNTAILDPFTKLRTLSLICNVFDPETQKPYSRDPRFISQKAEKYLLLTQIADMSYWGPEIEFYIFDNVCYDQTFCSGYYHIDSEEGAWNTGNFQRPNLGYKPRIKEGYFPVPPTDHLQDIRSEMVRTLEKSGVNVEVHHHEVGSGGQAEIDLRFDTLTKMGDQVLLYKYITKNVAHRYGKVVTMMPKPIFMDNGSGMHTHQSLWKDGKNLFYDKNGYAMISEMARWYIGGLLKHADALCALIAPSTNSYRRLVPGYEAPINRVYSKRNRSACIRIPMYFDSESSKRVEFRTPDPSCNPYLAFSAMLMAGLDGIKNKIESPAPIDKDLYSLSKEELQNIKSMPPSLEHALNALQHDCDFLLEGGVFTEDVIENWLDYKRKREVDSVRLRPHPHEFALYFDV